VSIIRVRDLTDDQYEALVRTMVRGAPRTNASSSQQDAFAWQQNAANAQFWNVPPGANWTANPYGQPGRSGE